MMIVHLIDFDSKIPNIALMRLSAYHKAKGDVVRFSRGKHPSIAIDVDKVYVSVIYKKHKQAVDLFVDSLTNDFIEHPTEIDIGGSGYDLSKVLPDEIDAMMPDYSIYPDCDSSYGFATRGCIRRCYFCIVPDKEGKLRRYQEPSKWHDPKFAKITFLDNNILADPDYFAELVEWCIARSLTVRFLSGFDIRLLTPDLAKIIFMIRKHHTISFAWDDILDESIIRDKVHVLMDAGFTLQDLKNFVQFYVYCDSDADYDTALYRCRELKKMNLNSFVMFNIDKQKTRRIKDLQRWANRKWLYWEYDIADPSTDDLLDGWI